MSIFHKRPLIELDFFLVFLVPYCNFTVVSKDPKSFTISLQIPDETHPHLQGFYIFYRSRNTSATENVTSYGLKSETTLPLTHWAVYEIHIVPFSLTGMGKKSFIQIAESMEAGTAACSVTGFGKLGWLR